MVIVYKRLTLAIYKINADHLSHNLENIQELNKHSADWSCENRPGLAFKDFVFHLGTKKNKII